MLKHQFAALAEETDINPFHPILASIFSSYAGLVHGICQPYTSDPLDISYILAAHWPLYISPLLNDWREANEAGEEYAIPTEAQIRLTSLFRQTIGSSVQPLHLRQISATDYISQTSPDDFNVRFSQIGHVSIALKGRKVLDAMAGKDEPSNVIGLPIMARYILVASYLGSYNPTKMDMRILGQIRDPTKKYKKGGARKQRTGTALKV
jgi:origin recognition complex subunit 5